MDYVKALNEADSVAPRWRVALPFTNHATAGQKQSEAMALQELLFLHLQNDFNIQITVSHNKKKVY